MEVMATAPAEYSGFDAAGGGVAPGVEGSTWTPSALECTFEGKALPLAACLLALHADVAAQPDAWPFQHAVSTEIVRPPSYERQSIGLGPRPAQTSSGQLELTRRRPAAPLARWVDGLLSIGS